ncbi:GTP cyclohydrolase FolE2 [Rossellomorea sp. BNER]|uniref:GTP cyclohydrolase FolE2 n=1 Tax=Rossellomorea sp. BNER TaxID=2962031 RepID=UPI003AF2CFEB|nr:GTP cyclohydrolase FolE2 [Rossellomorea sp. BNER]
MNLKLPSKQDRHLLFGSVHPGEKTKPEKKEEMVDLQSQKKDFLFHIDQVGICNLKVPVTIKSSLHPTNQGTIATFTLSSSLPRNQKGTNMSRFVELIEEYRLKGFTMEPAQLCQFVTDLSDRLGQNHVQLEVEFPWFFEKKSPSSRLTGLNHAMAKITVHQDAQNDYKITVELSCMITTLCPCSKEISEYSAHNQRGNLRMSVDTTLLRDDWKEELLYAAESNASACIYPLLKRPDEKVVTEKAYENPRFVEDMVRLVAAELYEKDWVKRFTVQCRNEESIHLHDAVATLSYSKDQ